MKEIEHLPDEWYIKDSEAVTKWFIKTFEKGISQGWFYNPESDLYLHVKNNQFNWIVFPHFINVIEITENQLFNIPKTKNKKDNKRLYEILNYIKENV